MALAMPMMPKAGGLPDDVWGEVAKRLDSNDNLAFSLTCKSFLGHLERKTKGGPLQTDVRILTLLQNKGSFTTAWFQAMVAGAEGEWLFDQLARVASFQNLRALRWLCEEAANHHAGNRTSGGTLALGPGRDGERCTTAAAAGGQLDALRYLRGRWQCQLAPESAVWAARGGHVDVLRWLASQGLEMDARACAAAAAGGWMEALQFLRTSGCEWDESTCASAAGRGHLDVLKWLRDQDPPCPWDYMTCSNAAEGGHLDVLKWLRDQDPPCPWDERTAEAAAREGHLDVLVWLRFQNCPWDASACSAAALGGNFAALRFLRQERCSWNGRTCSSAAKGGHLDVLKWLRSQDPPCPWSAKDCALKAEKAGHDHVVRWIKCNVM